MVAMSGGVDSSVAAALLVEAGHEVVGVTMKLWGGPSDSGCCALGDSEDARRVAIQLGIAHHVFDFSEEFDRLVVGHYVLEHASARTPNPCLECNRHLKFDRLLERAELLGFDALATGHHARVVATDGTYELRRGLDPAKDQSYVLYMLGQEQLSRLVMPVGGMTKAQVRAKAASLGLRTASKPDSQDVCFIPKGGGRGQFLSGRIRLDSGRAFDLEGQELGELDQLQLLTVGQRKGLGHLGTRGEAKAAPERLYVLDVDLSSARVTLGPAKALLTTSVAVGEPSWVAGPPSPGEALEVQTSAHGSPVPGSWAEGLVTTQVPIRRVAPGQAVVLYRNDAVVGGATVVGRTRG